jgi:hypothetical protein
MIKAIVIKICSPIQAFLDLNKQKRSRRMMMSYAIKINSRSQVYR